MGWRPRARFRGFYACGGDPLLMLIAPIAATREILKRTDMSIGHRLGLRTVCEAGGMANVLVLERD